MTPPRRNSRKRFRIVIKEERDFNSFHSQYSSSEDSDNSVRKQQQLEQPPEQKIRPAMHDLITSKPVTEPKEILPTGIFRRLRNRRMRHRQDNYGNLRYINNLRNANPLSRSNSMDQPSHHPSATIRCIPAEHPFKILWDFLTVVLSILNAYYTHIAIRDRSFDGSFERFKCFTETWFMVDILLNFVTEHRLGNTTLKTISAISARYLTTWFVVDVLSLIPGEVLYVKPVIAEQKARGWFKKWFLRTKSISKVTGGILQRWRAVRQCAKAYTKRNGFVAASRLIRAIIKYLPKYVLFLKHMKGVVAMRLLRQVHWFRKVYFNVVMNRGTEDFLLIPPRKPGDTSDDDTYSINFGDDDDDDDYIIHENDDWNEVDYDDDGDPY